MLSFNPAAYWRLNETAIVPFPNVAINIGSAGADVNGNYTGTAGTTFIHPTEPGALPGSSDGAVTLSGNGYTAPGYMLTPYNPILNTPAFTAEGWFNPAEVDGTLAGPTHCAFSCGDFASPRAGWLVYQSGEGWNLRMYNRNGTTFSLSISGGGAPVVGNWYHVAVVFDGTTARLYINGAQVASGAPSSYVPGTAGGLAVGVRSDNPFGWNGVADEVACYTNALSAEVIAAHYGAAKTNGSGYATQILADHPVACYRLNEPTYVLPDPSPLPVAANIGSVGADAKGTDYPGVSSAIAGPPYSGLGAGNYACQFDGAHGSSSPKAIAFKVRYGPGLPCTPWYRLEVRNTLRLTVCQPVMDSLPAKTQFQQIDADLKVEALLVHQAMDWTNVLRAAEKLGANHNETIGCRRADLFYIAAAVQLGGEQFLTFDIKQTALPKAGGLAVKP